MLQKYGWEVRSAGPVASSSVHRDLPTEHRCFRWLLFSVQCWDYYPTAGLVVAVILLWEARSCPHAYWSCFLIQAPYFPVSTSLGLLSHVYFPRIYFLLLYWYFCWRVCQVDLQIHRCALYMERNAFSFICGYHYSF